jgi:hypothetical protein
VELAEAGRMAEAHEAAVIGSAPGAFAEGLAKAARIAEAIEAAEIEDNIYWRSTLLAAIAKARAAAGRIDKAKQVTLHVTQGSDRVNALVSIADAWASGVHNSQAPRSPSLTGRQPPFP